MSHDHHPPPLRNFDRAFAVGIALNLGFVAVEAFYGWKVDSLALLADAAHNLSDVAGLVLAWVAVVVGRLAPDSRHTFGWQRASVLAALLNGLLLLMAMGALAWESLSRLQAPLPTAGGTIMAVAGVGVVINTLTALLFMRGRADDLNVRGAFLHMAADAAVSGGVVVAGGLSLWVGWRWLDPVVGLAIAAIIGWGTFGLLRQAVHLLFDGVPDGIDASAVCTWLSEQRGVTEVHDLHIWALSTSSVALSAHLVMPSGHPDSAFLDDVSEQLFHRYSISHPTLQIETEHCRRRACGVAGVAIT